MLTVALRDMLTSLRLPPFGARAANVDESRLLKLYWNRAELKKELADLDQELHQLRDRLKQQEAATLRLEDEFHALEGLLGNPDYGFEVLAHYQLRALWRACHGQLEQFGAELARQREERERKRQRTEYQQERLQKLRSVGERESIAEASLAQAQGEHAQVEAEHARLTSLWHYFRRRALASRLESMHGVVLERTAALADVRAVRRAIEQEAWPEFAGISLEGKRSINLAVIAYAQLLVSRLAAEGLAARTWTAQREHVRDCHYGSRKDCEQLMAAVAGALARVREAKDVVPELKTRAEKLRLTATYPHDEDAVPVSDSLPPNDIGAERALDEPSVLRDNSWDIFRVLRG